MLVERWITSSFEDRELALISRRNGVPVFFILLLYWNWCSYRLEIGVSGNLWIVVKDVRTLVVYDVEWETAMDSMKGKCASSWVDLGYKKSIFRSWGDISVLLDLWQCCWGLSRVQSSKSRLLMCLIGKRNCSASKAGESDLISWRGGSLMGFLELRQARGVHYRVTTGMPILNGRLFS